MKFIKLTGRTDTPVYVNLDMVCGINDMINNTSKLPEAVITFNGTCVFVKENQEEIMKIIEGTK